MVGALLGLCVILEAEPSAMETVFVQEHIPSMSRIRYELEIRQVDSVENFGIRLQYQSYRDMAGTAFFGEVHQDIEELEMPTFAIVERRYMGPGSPLAPPPDQMEGAVVILRREWESRPARDSRPARETEFRAALDPEDYPTWIRHPGFGWVYFRAYPWVYMPDGGWFYVVYHGVINLPSVAPDNVLNDRPEDDYSSPDLYYRYPQGHDVTIYWGDTAYWLWSEHDGWHWMRMRFAPYAWHLSSGEWRPISGFE